MISAHAHGGCGRFSANGARGSARKTKDEGRRRAGMGGACGDGRGNRSDEERARGMKKSRQGVSHSHPRGPAGVQSPRLFPRPARVSLPPIFPLAVLLLRSALLPLPCDCPLIPLPRLPTKKRAKFPPRVFSCGPDAAAVHRRIRTCIQNEARRASRS